MICRNVSDKKKTINSFSSFRHFNLLKMASVHRKLEEPLKILKNISCFPFLILIHRTMPIKESNIFGRYCPFKWKGVTWGSTDASQNTLKHVESKRIEDACKYSWKPLMNSILFKSLHTAIPTGVKIVQWRKRFLLAILRDVISNSTVFLRKARCAFPTHCDMCGSPD